MSDQKPPKNLGEFDAIYDLLEQELEDEQKRKKGGLTLNRNQDDNYELYHFLEIEIERLTKALDLLTHKHDNMEHHSQTQALIELQKGKIKQAKIELSKKYDKTDSLLLTELGILWDGLFHP